MCGITGFFTTDNSFTQDDLSAMNHCLAHRGPDADGFYFDGVCGLGHRRLSILDLSDQANQPMYSHDGRYVMVYNGEVYNYAEIAQTLEKSGSSGGTSWRTTSDSEVILEAFSKQGMDFLPQLNGMFAIAIFDTQTQALFLFRDRMGIKPLYYFWNGKDFAFSSELKALCSLASVPRTLNTSAIHQYLQLGYIPAPDTIYQQVFKMPAAAWIKITAGGKEEGTYWNLSSHISPETFNQEPQALQTLDGLLRSAVKYQLISDVPVGIFLSGGIDSSTIAAYASQVSETTVNTFSIGFHLDSTKAANIAQNRYNEADYARAVATRLGTNHHEFMVSSKESQDLVEKLMEVYDEPYADSSAIPTMIVSQLARKHVTVTLSGDGGDELFMGYGMYQWAERLSNPLFKLLRRPMATVLGRMKQASFRKAENMFRYTHTKSIPQHVFTHEQGFFHLSELDCLLTVSAKNGAVPFVYDPALPDSRRLSATEQQALFDLQYYLPDDLLVKVDRATMLYGLEARIPLLDHRLVEFALNLSPDLKVKNGERKYLLKKALYQYLPEKLFERPKQGFAIPLNEWLRTDLKYLLDVYLDEHVIRKAGVIEYSGVQSLVKRFLNGEYHLYNKVWLLVVLHQFLTRNNLSL
jgi:asparagine synthase (glutamine-hydrolysing)